MKWDFFPCSDYKKWIEGKKKVCLNKALGNVPCNDIESYNETDKPYENILKNNKAEMIC